MEKEKIFEDLAFYKQVLDLLTKKENFKVIDKRNYEYIENEAKHKISLNANYIIDSTEDFRKIDMYVFNETLLKDRYANIKRILTHYNIERKVGYGNDYIISGSNIYDYNDTLDGQKIYTFQNYVASMSFRENNLYECFVRHCNKNFTNSVNKSVAHGSKLKNIVSIISCASEENVLNNIIINEDTLKNGSFEYKVKTRKI